MKTSYLKTIWKKGKGNLRRCYCLSILAAIGIGLPACVGTTGIYTPTGYVGVTVDDRPYYVHGPGYWSGRSYYVWRPGHWRYSHGYRYWVHGRYVLRG